MKIGYSLSFCVCDIMNGAVQIEDVQQIVTNTSADNEQQWDRLIHEYCKTYWHTDPRLAQKIVQQLRDEGKISQPRIHDSNYHHKITRNFWKNVNELTS